MARATLTVLHMGDSITVGQYVNPAQRWTTIVEGRLRATLAGQGIDLVSLNHGVSGETTRIGLERFPAAVQQVRADVMTLQYGLNDCNGWQSDEGLPRVSERAFEANLIEMVTRARVFGARTVIIQTNHPTLRRSVLPSGEAYEDANARYSAIVRDVAAETGAVLCDIRVAFGAYSQDELVKLILPAPDELHLSEEGNRLYAEKIAPYVESAVAEAVDISVDWAGSR